MLKYDYFKCNYGSLAAFVEIDKKPSGISDFFHLPRIRIDDLSQFLPDTILIVDDHFGDAELKIRHFYLKKNLKPPRFFHLFPDNERPYPGITGFVRNHMAATVINKCLVAQALLLHSIISGPKELLLKFIKLNYYALLRVGLFRRLLEKVQQ